MQANAMRSCLKHHFKEELSKLMAYFSSFTLFLRNHGWGCGDYHIVSMWALWAWNSSGNKSCVPRIENILVLTNNPATPVNLFWQSHFGSWQLNVIAKDSSSFFNKTYILVTSIVSDIFLIGFACHVVTGMKTFY